MVLDIVLMTIGILALVESLIVLLFPKAMIKMFRNIKTLKKAGWWEFVIAIIIFIIGMNISPYGMANRFNHDPMRDRKLLLHKKEIKRLTGKLNERGYTLVPLKLYFKNGKAKILLGLGKGKAKYDKRKTIQKRDLDRELQREWKNR